MTHLAKTISGNNILTFCGKYIDRQVLGRRTQGRPPAVLYKKGQIPKNTHKGPETNSKWLFGLCEKCLGNPESVDTLNKIMDDVLKTRETVHISNGSASTASSYVQTLCGLNKTVLKHLKDDEGFILLLDYEEFVQGFRNKNKLCIECRDHPAVQLKDLANVEL